MQELVELAKELRRDPNFRGLILEVPRCWLDQLGDSAVFIKFFIKTRPMMQWTVKRELLRRIKKRSMNWASKSRFRTSTVYHRHEESELRADLDVRSAT
jgi:small conductance mechanosensitive channel